MLTVTLQTTRCTAGLLATAIAIHDTQELYRFVVEVGPGAKGDDTAQDEHYVGDGISINGHQKGTWSSEGDEYDNIQKMLGLNWPSQKDQDGPADGILTDRRA
jgi:hypothetical protein